MDNTLQFAEPALSLIFAAYARDSAEPNTVAVWSASEGKATRSASVILGGASPSGNGAYLSIKKYMSSKALALSQPSPFVATDLNLHLTN
jgi:hypothetical protein